MLVKKIFSEAEDVLKNHFIEDAIIGAKISAVTLNNGEIGSAFVLTEELKEGDDPFIFSKEAIGKKAIDVAKWALDPNEHILRRTLGMATINACAFSQPIANENVEATFAVEVFEEDIVGFVGYIRPLVKKLKDNVKRVIVFDNRETEEVYPPEKQAELLPMCDVVYITGSSFINHTIDTLLEHCSNARDIVLVGPTTPMFPKAYEGTKVRVISGGIWRKETKEEMFECIAKEAGVPKLSPFLQKKSMKIN